MAKTKVGNIIKQWLKALRESAWEIALFQHLHALFPKYEFFEWGLDAFEDSHLSGAEKKEGLLAVAKDLWQVSNIGKIIPFNIIEPWLSRNIDAMVKVKNVTGEFVHGKVTEEPATAVG